MKIATEQFLGTGSTSLFLHCGWGKTVAAAYLSSQISTKRLILHPRDVLGEQWYSTYRDLTDAKIWLVGSKHPIPNDPDVIICFYTQFHNIPVELLAQIGCLVLDEADRLCIPSCIKPLLGTSPQYVVACTATPDRLNDGMDRMFRAICGLHNVKEISVKPFDVYQLRTGITHPEEKDSNGVKWSELLNVVGKNQQRNRFIVNLVLTNLDRKFMLLTDRVEHAETLFQMFKDVNVQGGVDILVGRKKKYNNSRVLIGGYKKAGIGFDEKAACSDFDGIRVNALILCTSAKDPSKVEQAVGRVFRSDNPIIFDLVDSNKCLLRHWGERKKWYLSRNGQIHDHHLKIEN
jgi:superfamily II DNA or RNA helicase